MEMTRLTIAEFELPIAQYKHVLLASLLHDVDDRKNGGDGTLIRAKTILDGLMPHDSYDVKDILDMIKCFGTFGHGDDILQDACALPEVRVAIICDRATAIGMTGVMRTIAYSLESGRLHQTKDVPFEYDGTDQSIVVGIFALYNKYMSGVSATMAVPSTMGHILEKILPMTIRMREYAKMTGSVALVHMLDRPDMAIEPVMKMVRAYLSAPTEFDMIEYLRHTEWSSTLSSTIH